MKRKLEPQWGVDSEGKTLGNLGKFEVECPELTREDLQRMLDKSPAAFGEMVGGQLHIKFGSQTAKKKVMELLVTEMPKEKDEKAPDYLERTYARAQGIAGDILPAMRMDYVGAFCQWVDETFSKRGEKKTGDPIAKLIRDKWAGSTAEKREAFIVKFSLEDVTVESPMEDVLAAWERNTDML